MNKKNPFLVVLGVAQDAGHPHVGCQRACCEGAFEEPQQGHRVSCLGLVDPRSTKRWLLDATPSLPSQLRLLQEAQPTCEADEPSSAPELTGIFLTHAHMGHYTGLLYLGREGLGAHDIPVFAMPRMRALIESSDPWRQLLALGNIRLEPLAKNREAALETDLAVTPILVPHRNELSETVAFKIRGPQKTALFCPDTDTWTGWDSKLEELLAEVDLAFLDGTFFDADELSTTRGKEVPHPLVVDTMARLRALPKATREKVHFIHLNHTNPLLRADSAASQRVRKAGFHVAREGALHPLG